MNANAANAAKDLPRAWPAEGLVRLPVWIYSDEALYRKELDRFFAGNTWTYVGLDCEIPQPGDYKRFWIGDKQVIVVRDADGINVVENRCSHRSGAICWENKGHVKELTCPYHQWSFTLKGDLMGVPLKRGVHGEGGMPAGFDNKNHGLRKLRVACVGGSIWASFASEGASFEEYCGEVVMKRLRRTFSGRPLQVLGYSRQVIDCNWKLYLENTRDPYHGTLLHTFFITFGMYRADIKHVAEPTEGGKHAANYSEPGKYEGNAKAELTRVRDDLKLNDRELVKFIDEYGDGQMMGMQVFPGTFVQQHANMLAVRSIVPKSVGETEVVWTCFGYADDDEEMRRIRLKQANLIGSSGFVSMDDSELLKLCQVQVTSYSDAVGVVEMGGAGVAPQTGMATEVGIRAFYDYYRREMDL